MGIGRTNSFHLLLSNDELKLLKLLSEQEGLNASDYLRLLLRTMPGTSLHKVQALRLGAALVGKGDLFEAHSGASKRAKSKVDETKRNSAK